MNRKSIRAFGFACFLIGTSFILMDKYKITDTTTNQLEYERKITDLEQQLKKANEQIVTLKQEKNKTSIDDTKNLSKEVETETEIQNHDEVVHTTLHIYTGLTAYEIGKKLEDLGIVNNGLEMELFLAKPENAKSIQIGQFELDSTMTIEEIANIITGKE